MTHAARAVLFGLALLAVSSSGCSRTVEGDAANGDVPAPRADVRSNKGEESTHRVAVLAGGCFWCTEAVFEELDGVIRVESGYAGGTKEDAEYRKVASGRTDHAEAVRIVYDPRKITFGKLLHVFFSVAHDPTQKNRQGPDRGRQYRSAIFYANDEQKRVAAAYIQQLEKAKTFNRPIATTLEPLGEFYPAERYHQNFAKRNPYHRYVRRYAVPKAHKARKAFGEKTGED